MQSIYTVSAVVAVAISAAVALLASFRARLLQPDLAEQFHDTLSELRKITGHLRVYFETTQARIEAGDFLNSATGVSVGAYVAVQNATNGIGASHAKMVDWRFGDTSAQITATAQARVSMICAFLWALLAAVLQIVALFAR